MFLNKKSSILADSTQISQIIYFFLILSTIKY